MGDVTHTEKIKNNSNLSKAGSLNHLSADREIIMKWAIRVEKYDEIVWTECI